MRARYGTVRNGELRCLIQNGLREAWRITRVGLVCKVTPQVHNERFQAEQAWVEEILGVPYQCVHAVRTQKAGYHLPPHRSA
jgi:hypothetical protein